MTDARKWNDRYQSGDAPWDTGRPSPQLQRVLRERNIRPCRRWNWAAAPGPTASGWPSKALT